MIEIINSLKSLIFFIGIVTTLYLIYRYFIKPILEKKDFEEYENNFKIETLCNLHPKINKMFKEFEQYQNKKYIGTEDDYLENKNSKYFYTIFGRKTFAYDEYDIKEFRAKVLNKIIELEQTEASEIKNLLNQVKTKKELYNSEEKLRNSEKNYLIHFCTKTLNELFPVYATFTRNNEFTLKTEDEIKSKLKLITTYPYNDSNVLFEKLIDYSILLKKTIDKNDFYYIDKKY